MNLELPPMMVNLWPSNFPCGCLEHIFLNESPLSIKLYNAKHAGTMLMKKKNQVKTLSTFTYSGPNWLQRAEESSCRSGHGFPALQEIHR